MRQIIYASVHWWNVSAHSLFPFNWYDSNWQETTTCWAALDQQIWNTQCCWYGLWWFQIKENTARWGYLFRIKYARARWLSASEGESVGCTPLAKPSQISKRLALWWSSASCMLLEGPELVALPPSLETLYTPWTYCLNTCISSSLISTIPSVNMLNNPIQIIQDLLHFYCKSCGIILLWQLVWTHSFNSKKHLSGHWKIHLNQEVVVEDQFAPGK